MIVPEVRFANHVLEPVSFFFRDRQFGPRVQPFAGVAIDALSADFEFRVLDQGVSDRIDVPIRGFESQVGGVSDQEFGFLK